jgi:hypothetical protein
VIDNDFGAGILLIDAPAAACEALRTDVWVVGLEDAADLASTTCSASEENPQYDTVTEDSKYRNECSNALMRLEEKECVKQ